MSRSRPAPGGPSAMAKAYEPQEVERRWRAFWEKENCFRADPGSGRPAFSMVIPPPNITGRLHVGHGLNNTLQDILARWKRMSGFDVLWLPGSDHASIATHVMIERALEKEGTTRQDLGREAFLERAWEWKAKYGSEITDQLRRLGASCDWSRERFTLDPGLSRAVREVFVRLYEDGLIYRGRYMINWCTRCGTAVSDLEVVHKEVRGSIWTVSYPLEGGGEIRVATTRPETILGDAAVAVHPDDERYQSVTGRYAVLPVLGRNIPVLADGFVDPEFGTGAVKVTPAHDPNDFEAGRRLGLEPIVVMDERGTMTGAAGPFAGQDRFACRRGLLERLESEGRVVATEEHLHSVGHCQRCNTVVEPMISLQWFVRIEPLAGPALSAVEEGRIAFVPDSWRKTYYEWMRNIRDWCISRQLWWGHRIPAWYCDPCGETIVRREDPDRCPSCGGPVRQDPDILDTWFSSGLWAFSTLGWPDRTADLGRYYPGTVLVTGYDIIFFWVARMVMLSLRFMDGEVPFRAVFYNGLVRDAHGEKISKTRGNVIDLFDLLDRYGADGVRFTYAALTTPGSDVSLDPGRLEGSRAFANKIWNVARYAMPHIEALDRDRPGASVEPSIADRWIRSRLSRVAGEVDRALEGYRFDDAAESLYHFAWHEFCDWYVEISKAALAGPDPVARSARRTLHHVLENLVRMLHPFMPFLTEELYQALPSKEDASRPRSVTLAGYPRPDPSAEDPEAERAMQIVMDVVTVRRNLQAGLRGAVKSAPTVVVPAHAEARAILETMTDVLACLTRSTDVTVAGEADEGVTSIRGVTSDALVVMPIEGVDLAAERERLQGEIDRTTRDLTVHQAKLSNPKFVQRAKPEAVQKVRVAHEDLTDRLSRLRATLDQLGG